MLKAEMGGKITEVNGLLTPALSSSWGGEGEDSSTTRLHLISARQAGGHG